MKRMLIAATIVVLSACSNNSQSTPTMPSLSSGTGANAAQSTAGAAVSHPADVDDSDHNHFAPPPLFGWDATKWHDLTVNTPKYQFGRALVGLDVTEENLKRVAESQGLTYLGSDLVRFSDGTVVDAIGGKHTSSPFWQYVLSH